RSVLGVLDSGCDSTSATSTPRKSGCVSRRSRTEQCGLSRTWHALPRRSFACTDTADVELLVHQDRFAGRCQVPCSLVELDVSFGPTDGEPNRGAGHLDGLAEEHSAPAPGPEPEDTVSRNQTRLVGNLRQMEIGPFSAVVRPAEASFRGTRLD